LNAQSRKPKASPVLLDADFGEELVPRKRDGFETAVTEVHGASIGLQSCFKKSRHLYLSHE